MINLLLVKKKATDDNNCSTYSQAEKLINFNKLMNIATYFNQRYKNDGTRLYYITSDNGKIKIDWRYISIKTTEVAFNTYKSAEMAVKILGEITIANMLNS